MSYTLLHVKAGTPEWHDFHSLRHSVLFRNSAQYDPLIHDSPFPPLAHRYNLLLNFNDRKIGALTLDDLRDRRMAVRGIAIAKNLQRLGHGLILGRLAESFAKARGAEILCANVDAEVLSYYQKLGFEEQSWNPAELPRYAGHMVLQMIKTL